MPPVVLCLVCALSAYGLSGINPAIILSHLIYHQDIRELGSKNPGFTNFKRVYGSRYAWFVFVLDIFKSIFLCLVFCPLFRRCFGSYALGAAFTGLFAMLGHCFPIWYHFQGGKGFLVGAATIFFIDWRAGLIATAVMLLLLFTAKYMSLAVIVAALTCPISLALLGVDCPAVFWHCLSGVCLLVTRHTPNIRRLCNGTESKFHLTGK